MKQWLENFLQVECRDLIEHDIKEVPAGAYYYIRVTGIQDCVKRL